MVVVTASPASAERMVREGSDDLLRFEGFAGGSSHGRIVRVPDGLPADAVGHEGFDAQQFEYVGVVWSRGHVVGMVQIAGPTGDLGHQLAQLARLQDRRMAGFA